MADSTLEWSNLRYTPTEYKRIELANSVANMAQQQYYDLLNGTRCNVTFDVCVLQTNLPHIITSDLHSYKCVLMTLHTL